MHVQITWADGVSETRDIPELVARDYLVVHRHLVGRPSVCVATGDATYHEDDSIEASPVGYFLQKMSRGLLLALIGAATLVAPACRCSVAVTSTPPGTGSSTSSSVQSDTGGGPGAGHQEVVRDAK